MADIYEERTGWTGWIAFAGIMMLIGGSLGAIQGLVAVLNDEWVVWGNRANLYLDLSAWGWLHMLVGVILFASGLGVFSGNVLARTVGVIVASLSLIVNFLFIPAYPIWAITVITIDAMVIWAPTAHGSEMRRRRRVSDHAPRMTFGPGFAAYCVFHNQRMSAVRRYPAARHAAGLRSFRMAMARPLRVSHKRRDVT